MRSEFLFVQIFLIVIAKPPNSDLGADAIQGPLTQCLVTLDRLPARS